MSPRKSGRVTRVPSIPGVSFPATNASLPHNKPVARKAKSATKASTARRATAAHAKATRRRNLAAAKKAAAAEAALEAARELEEDENAVVDEDDFEDMDEDPANMTEKQLDARIRAYREELAGLRNTSFAAGVATPDPEGNSWGIPRHIALLAREFHGVEALHVKLIWKNCFQVDLLCYLRYPTQEFPHEDEKKHYVTDEGHPWDHRAPKASDFKNSAATLTECFLIYITLFSKLFPANLEAPHAMLRLLTHLQRRFFAYQQATVIDFALRAIRIGLADPQHPGAWFTRFDDLIPAGESNSKAGDRIRVK